MKLHKKEAGEKVSASSSSDNSDEVDEPGDYTPSNYNAKDESAIEDEDYDIQVFHGVELIVIKEPHVQCQGLNGQ